MTENNSSDNCLLYTCEEIENSYGDYIESCDGNDGYVDKLYVKNNIYNYFNIKYLNIYIYIY